MLKKTCVASGLLIAAAAGATITSLPAFAAAPAYGGGCCSGSQSRFAHFTHNRSWNGSENESLNRVRLHIRNRNNNIATARTSRRGEEGRGEEGRGMGAGGAVGAPGV